jgi:hypothetical protein
MKKVYLALATCCTIAAAQAQMQRIVLVEEFTQASCPPCAAQNPALNATLSSNTTKAVSIKYQTDWPGFDPMNLHNPSEVSTRVSYYGVTGVPNVSMDGGTKAAPGTVTTASINARYNTPATYSINLSHTISPDFSTVNVHAVVKPLVAGAGAFKVHLVVVEKEIHFTAAPGTNGEKDFYSVMKKMLPSDQGTDVPATLAVGDSMIIDESWVMANVYDKNQVAVVGFVQNNTDKKVQQAVLSAPQAVVPDASITGALASGSLVCANSVDVTATVKNVGPGVMTDCTIRATTATGVYTDYPWSGSLATGQTANKVITVPLPSTGAINIEVRCLNPNTGDNNAVNDALSTSVTHPAAATTTMPNQDFATATAATLAGFASNGNNNDAYSWTRVTQGVGGSNGSMKLQWYDIVAGNEDDLYLPALDLTGVPTAILTFYVAHAQYATGDADDLRVRVSTDCGASWTDVYDKSGAALATVAVSTAAFTPTAAASQWRQETVNLDSYIGQANVLVDFNGTSDYGNNVYLDKINISTVVGTENTVLDSHVAVFPNPTTGAATANITLDKTEDVTITVTNTLGQEVARQTIKNTNGGNFAINLAAQPAGNYLVHIATESGKTTKKITKL